LARGSSFKELEQTEKKINSQENEKVSEEMKQAIIGEPIFKENSEETVHPHQWYSMSLKEKLALEGKMGKEQHARFVEEALQLKGGAMGPIPGMHAKPAEQKGASDMTTVDGKKTVHPVIIRYNNDVKKLRAN